MIEYHRVRYRVALPADKASTSTLIYMLISYYSCCCVLEARVWWRNLSSFYRYPSLDVCHIKMCFVFIHADVKIVLVFYNKYVQCRLLTFSLS